MERMKPKTAEQKYEYFKAVLDKLKEYPLIKNPKIDDLKPPRGVMQAAYKEMYKIDFEGTLIDYLCWVYLVYYLENEKLKIKNPKEEIHITGNIVLDLLPSISKLYLKDENIKLIIRLLVRQPKIFYRTIWKYDEPKKEKKTEKERISNIHSFIDLLLHIWITNIYKELKQLKP